MTSFGALRIVRVKALDALGRLIVQGIANLPAAPFLGLLWGLSLIHI